MQQTGSLVAVATLLAALPALAESPFYVSVAVGAYLREGHQAPFAPLFGTSPTISFDEDPGPALTLALGYRLSNGFRLEGEFGYARYQTTSVSFSGSPFLRGTFDNFKGANQNRYMATMAAYYDLPVDWPLIPYFGLGIGLVHTDASKGLFLARSVSRVPIPGTGLSSAIGGIGIAGTSEQHGLAHGEFGVTIPLDDSWAIVPSYRYTPFTSQPENPWG